MLQKMVHDVLVCTLFENGRHPLSEVDRKLKIKIRTYTKGGSMIRVGALKEISFYLNR